MAGCDYYSCDACGGKAFYDANLDYDGEVHVEYGCGMKLGYVGDMAVICDECSKTHHVEVAACNAHAGLVEALKGMLGAWNMVCDANGWERDHIQQQKDAVAALAAAGMK